MNITEENIKDLEVVLGLAISSEYLDSSNDKACDRVEKLIKTLKQVKNNDLLYSVSDSLPVACTMEDDKGELGWTRLSVKYAGEVITNLSKKVKAFENFIDSFNENYR